MDSKTSGPIFAKLLTVQADFKPLKSSIRPVKESGVGEGGINF